jgi:hypothetical protein
MAVSLTRIVHGTAVNGTLTNSRTVQCPRCEQQFQLGYSDSEWNRVEDWLLIAHRAIREDHKRKHDVATLGLEWKPSRKVSS